MFRMLAAVILFTIFIPTIQAQRFTVHGTVTDQKSGEQLIAASIFDMISLDGANSNNYGFYSLSLKQGKIKLKCAYVGYEEKLIEFVLNKDTLINIQLNQGLTLQEVEIVSSREERIERSTRMSTIDVPIEQIKKVPALFGEVDVLKALQLLPGVNGGSEGTSGLYVRGGSPDQNLILLDGTPVYNVYHLGGIFSVFNADALKNVSLTKGGFPARYGGRLSSILEINMKEGNMTSFHGEGGIGIISSRLALEGPIVKNKASFMISGRRTYLDVIAAPFLAASQTDEEKVDLGLHFYDLNAKMNWIINPKHRLYLSGYLGEDLFSTGIESKEVGTDYTKTDAGIDWGNITTALRWNYNINPKLFANTSLNYSKYQFNFRAGYEEQTNKQKEAISAVYLSGIEDYTLKTDFDYAPLPNHSVKFGSQIIRHRYNPGASQFKSNVFGSAIDTTLGDASLWATESSLYAEDDMRFGSLGLNLGVHTSGFYVQQKFFTSLQPRIAARYLLRNDFTVKASFATMTQYINLLTNEGAGLPSDLWVPSTKNIQPQNSWQSAVGLVKVFKEDYECSVEAYYKKMNRVLSYKEGASFFEGNSSWEDRVTQGEGEAYGMEFFVQKKKGKFNGWIGYTLSWNYRQFDEINSGNKYRFRYDRRHDFEIVANYQISKTWAISGSWQYATGNAITLPLLKYQTFDPFNFYNFEIEIQGEKNGYTMPPYHRLDLSVEYRQKRKKFEEAWVFGVYNAYARANPFFITTDREYDGREYKTVFKQVALLPLIPNISYQFKF